MHFRSPLLLRRPLIAAVAAVSGAAALAGPAQAADRTATPSTLASVFSAAQGGDTILLASGSYGTFRGGAKASTVTFKEQEGATASMALAFNPASNLTFDGLTITHAELAGAATRNITVRNSQFTGMITLRTATWNNANILLDRNTHIGIDVCSGCGDGRIYLPSRNENAVSGVTISNSLFEKGNADGILNGSNGTRIIGNEFRNFVQGDAAVQHTDPIQLYGSKNTVVKGNYIHHNQVAAAVMAPDGVQNEVFEDNVIDTTGSGDPRALNFGGDEGSIVRHNTIRGTVLLKADKTGAPSRGTVVIDNTISTLSLQGGSTMSGSGYNVVGSGTVGATDLRGMPTYSGGTSPATMAGYVLASGSLGKGTGSDGLDMGARHGVTAPVPEPTPTPEPTPDSSDVAAQAVWTVPTGAVTGTPVRLDGTASKGNGPLTCTWTFENADGTTVYSTNPGCSIEITFQGTGTKHARLSVKDADGDTHSSTQSFVVGSPTPTPTPTPTPDVAAQAVWTAPTGVVTGTPVTLDGTASKGDGPLTCTWTFENSAGSEVYGTNTGCSTSKSFQSTGTKYVKLTVKDADGDTHSSKKSFTVAARTSPKVGTRIATVSAVSVGMRSGV